MLWCLCLCYYPINLHNDSCSIGSNSENLYKFSRLCIRYIKNIQPKIAIDYTYLNIKFSQFYTWNFNWNSLKRMIVNCISDYLSGCRFLESLGQNDGGLQKMTMVTIWLQCCGIINSYYSRWQMATMMMIKTLHVSGSLALL